MVQLGFYFPSKIFPSLKKKTPKSPKSEHFIGRKEPYPHSAWIASRQRLSAAQAV